MKNRYSFFVLLLCLLGMVGATTLSAQRKTPTYEEMMDVNGAQGTEFWIMVPPNEVPGYTVNALEVYVASAFETEVTVYEAETQKTYKRTIKPGQIRTLSDSKGETNWNWEMRNEETVEYKGIRLTATKPISVYVLNSKYFTSDGYLALPSSVWGTDYIVTGYYDFQEIRSWPGGFTIVSREDGTEVEIDLKGAGAAYAKTAGGRSINTNQPFRITLDKGATYMVHGDGLTRGVFDLTGTRIRSTKAIGLCSFHMRTTMPNLLINGNGRNYMVEMTPPVSTWGKNYVTVEYSREHNGQGRGDMFRVIASEPTTRVSFVYYDKATKQKLGNGGFVLNQAGDFIDYSQSSAPTALPEGTSIWTADKPIFVMQYSCSSSWDNDINLDPFMINVTPVEQFITSTIFQQPTLPAFTKHRLNLLIQTDTASPDLVTNLKSLNIDSIPCWSDPRAISPKLLSNRIPGTDLYWTSIDFGTDGKAHKISGNGKVKFGGYIYGFGQTDAYGWPAAASFKPTKILDTMPPLFTETQVCGDWSIKTTEKRNIPDPPRAVPKDSDQVETGVAEIDFVQDDPTRVSKNYRIDLITSQDLPRNPSWKEFNFQVNVIDKSQDAIAYIYIKDWANNVTYDTVEYFADRITFNPNPLSFGKNRLGNPKQLTVQMQNASTSPVDIKTVKLQIGARYKIISGAVPPTVSLPAGGSVPVVIEYDAARETSDILTDLDKDSLVVESTCSAFKIPITGVAAQPHIQIEDFDAGMLSLNTQKCKAGGLKISNPGSDTLVITSFRNVGSNFTLSNPTTPPLPIVIAPKQSVYLTDVCYSRGTVGKDSIDVSCETNGAVGDSVSTWTGATQAPGLFITDMNWLLRRVNTVKAGFVVLTNSGTEPVTVSDVTFTTGGKYFPNGSNDNNFIFKITGMTLRGAAFAGGQLTASNGVPVDSVIVNLEFRPDAEQTYTATVAPTITAPANLAPPIGKLDGVGILPKITTKGDAWTCAETPDGQAVVKDLVITNPSTTEDLVVSGLAFAAGTNPAFAFAAGAPTTPFTIAKNNGTQRIGVQFTRPAGGGGTYNATVEITHNGKQGGFPAVRAENPVPPDTLSTESFSVGGCSGPDIVVTNIDFGNNLANCETPEREFTITNTGGGLKPLRIESITAVDADAAAFTIVGITNPAGAAATTPLLITPGESYRVRVRFTPTEPNAAPWANRSYSARFHIVNYMDGETTELKPNTYATVVGVGYVVPVRLDISNTTTGSQTIRPGENIYLTVSGSSNNWTPLGITSFTATMLYDQRTMNYNTGTVQRAAQLDGTWNIAAPTFTALTDSTAQLTFVATGTTPITADGPLFTFNVQSLLSGAFTFYQNLSAVFPRPCIVATTTGDSTTIYNCAITKRVVTVSGTKFSIGEIAPNPSTGGDVAVDLSVGFNAVTTIEIMNQLGQVVRTLQNDVLETGAYTLSFPTTDLGSGVYFLRMRSADFNETRRIVISK